MFEDLQSQVILGGLVAATICLAWYNSKRNAGLPPGPGGYPYVGTQLKHVKGARWFLYTDWAKKYGDVVYFKSYGRENIVLNTFEAARALLVLRGRIYSDRPKLVMAREIVGYDNSIALADNTPRVVFMRKAVQTELAPKNLGRFQGIQALETELFLGKLLDNPEGWHDHVRILIAYSIFSVAYGYRPKSDNEELLVMIKKMMEDFAVFAAPGNFLVDNIPILKYLPEWFPGTAWKKFGKAANQRIEAVCKYPYDQVLARKEKEGQAGLSVTASFLQMPDITPEREHQLRWASEAVYAAGSDTTVSAIRNFVLAMVLNQDSQAKAHAELDAWLGLAELRLPTFEDRPNLPYLDKLLWETLRWYPVVPLGLPHRVIQDDVYEGYRIPKGATVIANIWNILHDSSMYPDPWTFNPDRYDASSTVDGAMNMDPRKVMFGFGRRQCAGMHLAEASLWLAIVNVLMVYKIEPVDDLPKTNFTPGVISQVLPFKAKFTPRSDKAEALIRAQYKIALDKVRGGLAQSS